MKNILLAVLGYLLRLLYRNKIKHGSNIVYTKCDLISNLTVALIYFHRYEKDEIRLCKKYLTSQLDIIELGTSIGVVALSIQQELGVRKMICVEANLLLHGVLKKTFKHNNLKNIQLLNVAISDSNQPVYFSTRDSSELGKIVPHSEIKVNTKSLQQIIEENNILEYNLICDIEGAECSFILDKGLQNCQLAIIELHSTLWKEKRYSVEELSNMIQEKGFDLLECINSTFVFKRNHNKA